MANMIAGPDRERLLWCALHRAYQQLAPRHRSGRRVSSRNFARLTREQVDKQWDFADRHLAHDIAKALHS